MKKAVIVSVLLVLCIFSLFSQNENYELKISKSSYFVKDTNYDALFIQIINKIDSSLITWIDKDVIADFTDKEKIKKYFFSYNDSADFSLFDLTWEHLSTKIPVILYSTFYKIIHPKEMFQIIILLEDKENLNIEEWIKNHLSVVKRNTDTLLTNQCVKRLDYKNDFIVLYMKDIIKVTGK